MSTYVLKADKVVLPDTQNAIILSSMETWRGAAVYTVRGHLNVSFCIYPGQQGQMDFSSLYRMTLS